VRAFKAARRRLRRRDLLSGLFQRFAFVDATATKRKYVCPTETLL
jgi:hypothetical protein